MAALTCPRGHENPGDGTVCVHCGGFLRKERPPAEAPDESPRNSRAAPSALRTCAEPGCELELTDGVCLLHGDTAPTVPAPGRAGEHGGTGLALVFPWGTYPLGPTALVVGRSVAEAGELAERMLEHGRWTGNDYGNVSRAHAVVWSDDDGTWIRQVGTTNQTRVNGSSLPPDQPHRLRAGDVLVFARGLRAHVAGAAAE